MSDEKKKVSKTSKTEDKYVAYVSTYTMGDNHGIKIYDVDMNTGRFSEKDEVEISNSSYVTCSHNGKFLYSITDLGVESYKINPDGTLDLINFAPINGMRGCYIATDYTDKYLMVAGYHDGKLTVLHIKDNGGVGKITDEVFHKGLGSLADRNFRPHIASARMTHDNRYILVADQGMDHVNVYELNKENGKIKLVDIIRCDLESSPRQIKLSKDGRYIYICLEATCKIDVYEYTFDGKEPHFEKIQAVDVVKHEDGANMALSALSFSQDYKYLLTTIAGDNSVAIFSVDEKTGMLEKKLLLPVSGDYPKDAEILPGNKFLVSLNHESNEMSFFKLDIEHGQMVMNGNFVHVNTPNCIVIHKLDEDAEEAPAKKDL